ncbi:MAG TPA: HAMP domain-containing sensor histidine kinase, partial [Vicinamibacterales bacterium]|nr:HAMP domain-containing sensor histidine kinase [Vicinamibacterales bacterium]
DDLTIGHTQQLSDIGKAAERGEAMLTDMLDFLRTMDGGISIARRRVDLKVVCERVVDAIHSNNPDRAMLFTSDSRVEGQWDPDRMAILVSKLVINAIDHSPAWPAVRVELRSLPDQAVLIVWNAGSIAQPEAAHRLFDPFVCGHMRRPTGSEGLGLGLFLAREIAHAHGGRIEVLSGDADGTTFRVTVPRE